MNLYQFLKTHIYVNISMYGAKRSILINFSKCEKWLNNRCRCVVKQTEFQKDINYIHQFTQGIQVL